MNDNAWPEFNILLWNFTTLLICHLNMSPLQILIIKTAMKYSGNPLFKGDEVSKT